MAIVSCPSCDKNISSRTELCPYCGFERDEVAEERLRELRRRKLRDRIYHLKMASYVALTLLIGAFAWYLADTQWFQYRSSMGPYIMFGVGSVFYLGIRVYLLKFRVALRKLSF
jgi:drug/metabolite transporter (DMT)-like permease